MSRILLPPFPSQIDGATVYILEVTARKWLDGQTHYLVSVMVEWNGKRSQVFSLDVTSNEELIAKLKAEIAKFKSLFYSGLLR